MREVVASGRDIIQQVCLCLRALAPPSAGAWQHGDGRHGRVRGVAGRARNQHRRLVHAGRCVSEGPRPRPRTHAPVGRGVPCAPTCCSPGTFFSFTHRTACPQIILFRTLRGRPGTSMAPEVAVPACSSSWFVVRGAGLARLVSEAQSKEAPVQRLADMVAGRFCYGARLRTRQLPRSPSHRSALRGAARRSVGGEGERALQSTFCCACFACRALRRRHVGGGAHVCVLVAAGHQPLAARAAAGRLGRCVRPPSPLPARLPPPQSVRASARQAPNAR